MRLVELLKRPEGKTLEYKRDLSSPEGILKTLVAFANTAGGTVIIGVEDGSKHVRGVNDVLRLKRSWRTSSPIRYGHDSSRILRWCRGER